MRPRSPISEGVVNNYLRFLQITGVLKNNTYVYYTYFMEKLLGDLLKNEHLYRKDIVEFLAVTRIKVK